MKMNQWTALAGVFAMALLSSAPQGVAQDEPPPPAEGNEQAVPLGGTDAADASVHVVVAPNAAASPAPVSGTSSAAAFGTSVVPAKPGESAAPGGPKGGDRMEQFRQRMNEFLKTALKVSDEEWAIIQPLLEKVQIKQREASGPRMGFFGGRRGGTDRPRPPGAPATPDADALKAALENEATAPADIKIKLEALREARKKAASELAQAREDLRKVLTQRQEATLVLAGILE